MQLSPLLKHCKFSYKMHFYAKFYNGLRDCSGFLQIGSHMIVSAVNEIFVLGNCKD